MAKKKIKKAAAKKSTKKAPAKKAPAAKSGLRKPQVRILQYLSKQKKERTRQEIANGAEVDYAMLNSYIGAHDAKKRAANDKNFKCLRTLKFVKVEEKDVNGKDTVVHSITALGKKALAKV